MWKTALAAIALALAIGVDAAAVSRQWTGAVDDKWSTPGNWDPAGTPASGDHLSFPFGTPAEKKVSVNDLDSSVVLASLSFIGVGFEVSGNTIRVGSGGIGGCGWVIFHVRVQAEADSSLGAESFAELDPNGYSVRVCGPVQQFLGTGTVTLNNGAPYHFSGSHPFSGTFTNGVPGAGSTLVLDNASLPAATFDLENWLQGSGTIGPLQAGNDVIPSNGANPIGSIATGDLLMDSPAFLPENWSDYQVDIGSAGNDSLDVTGSVTIDDTSLAVSVIGGFTPPIGSTYTIINNDGADAVTGILTYRTSSYSGFLIPLTEGAAFQAGGHTFRISYAGGTGNDVVLTASSPTSPTATALDVSCEQTCSAPPPSGSFAVTGQPVTLTATVSGSPTPTGEVSFYDGPNGQTLLGTVALAGGSAALTTTFTPGSYALYARYSGSETHDPSESTGLALQVARSPSRIFGTATPTGGNDVLIEAIVSASGLGGGTPDSGNVAITEGSTSLGSPAVNDRYASQTIQLSPGPHTLTLYYSGDSLYEPSITTVSVTLGHPVLNTSGASSREGSSGEQMVVEIDVVLSATSETVTVQYSTSDGTAQAGSDYVPASGTLTFAPGETHKTISVALVADNVAEQNETFSVTLWAATGATIEHDEARVTILNDDKPGRSRSVRK